MYKKRKNFLLFMLLVSLIILSGCGSSGSSPDADNTISLTGTIYVSSGTQLSKKNAGFLKALLRPKVKAEALTGENPLANANVIIKNFATNAEITSVKAGANGEYQASGIPENIDLIIIASDNNSNVRVSALAADLGPEAENSSHEVDLNTATTLTAENLLSKREEIKNLTPDSLNKTLQAVKTYVEQRGTDKIDLSVGGDIISDQIGEGLKDSEINSEINDVFGLPIAIPDNNLENVIRAKINKSNGTIYSSEVEFIEELKANNKDIADISGLEHLSSLKVLDLGYEKVDGEYPNNNSISDLDPIASLDNLEELLVYKNNISDINSISGLNNLVRFSADVNNIDQIPDLSEITKLTRLDLAYNNISDISNLSSLTQLDSLDISDNNISDVSSLSSLSQLTMLLFRNNQVEDVSPIANLNKLKYLFISGNPISDYTPLESIYDQLIEKDFEIN